MLLAIKWSCIKEKGFVMSVFYINGDKMEKIRHHKDIWLSMRASVTIPEEMSGCADNRFFICRPKSVRFVCRTIEADANSGKLRVWYIASSTRDFFKVSIRLQEPYVGNIGKIGEILSTAFLELPNGKARGVMLEDVPGNITSKSVIGMESYTKAPSKRTLELAELMGQDNEKKRIKSFDYWVYDQKMLDRGLVLTVGNENGIEFIRYHVLESLQEEEKVVTAYVRPCFCEEYDM